jgi:chemotaxis protein methyltransferase WspC
LFVGPSETGLLSDHGFVSAGIPLAFAFRLRGSPVPRLRPREPPATGVAVAIPVIAKPSKPAAAARPQSRPTPPGKTIAATPATAQWIEQARHLANQGRLVEALECCEQNSSSHPACAETFHLIGLLHDSAGRVREAAEHYRKALYLDPRHLEALMHLAVALQKEGDARGAQRLFERANRQSSSDQSKGGG